MTLETNDDHEPLTAADAGEENEVLRAVRERKQQEQAAEEAEAADGRRGKRIGWKTAAAAGIGIGSAAVLAALLYAGRDRK
ncbi:hypothetical protein KNJ79_03205 [Sphingopyxis indica]|uniref:hypothetical protein n=1 Tax=Sphingopyxis indica TaxID=436663 RepID=UPI0029393CB8|nr:hypothetical protein [Sphingopyxis indica]WOF43974.1 hypothetical protein KNJ79_03205 [Sphingopyxis indica]